MFKGIAGSEGIGIGKVAMIKEQDLTYEPKIKNCRFRMKQLVLSRRFRNLLRELRKWQKKCGIMWVIKSLKS